MTEATEGGLAARVDTIEGAYEFMLAYAAQGRADDGDPALSQVRALLTAAAGALDGIDSAAREAFAAHPAREKCAAFLDVLAEDARKALAATRLTLSARSISSQLVDNLNGSIHLRALLTDVFIVDEFLKNG